MLDVHGEGGGVALWANRGIQVARGNACKLNYSRVRAFLKKQLDTCHIVANWVRTPIPKLHFLMFLSSLSQGLSFAYFGAQNFFYCLFHFLFGDFS